MLDDSQPAVAAANPHPAGIDPRGPRIGAAFTAVLLVAVLLLAPGAAARIVMSVVVVLFLIGVVAGAQGSVHGRIFRTVIRPRLAPPAELEDPRPPRFAQLVGLVITALGLALDLAGVPYALAISAGFVLVAAFLNAAFGFCLGCEMYLVIKRRAPTRHEAV
jgi:hypothetical protein